MEMHLLSKASTRRIKANFGDSLALRDFVRDVKLVMRSIERKGKMQKSPQNVYHGRGEDILDGGDGGDGSQGRTVWKWFNIENVILIGLRAGVALICLDWGMIEIEMQERHPDKDARLQMQNHRKFLALVTVGERGSPQIQRQPWSARDERNDDEGDEEPRKSTWSSVMNLRIKSHTWIKLSTVSKTLFIALFCWKCDVPVHIMRSRGDPDARLGMMEKLIKQFHSDVPEKVPCPS